MRLILLQLAHQEDHSDDSSVSDSDDDQYDQHAHLSTGQSAEESRSDRHRHHALRARLRDQINNTPPLHTPITSSKDPNHLAVPMTASSSSETTSPAATAANLRRRSSAYAKVQREREALQSLRVSRTTGRLSMAKPRRSYKSRRASSGPSSTASGDASARQTLVHVANKDDTAKTSGSIFGRMWTRLFAKMPSSSNSRLGNGRIGTASFSARTSARINTIDRAHVQNLGREEASVGVTSQDVEEDPFEHRRDVNEADEDMDLEAMSKGVEEAMAHGREGCTEEDLHYAAKATVKRLTHEFRLPWERQTLSVFLTKDGTVITIWSKGGANVVPSIVARLRSKDTILRSAEDPSMLLQAILDTVVDRALDLADSLRIKVTMVREHSFIPASLVANRARTATRNRSSVARS